MLHARHSALLAAPLLLFAMDALSFHGRRQFLFLRRTVFCCVKERSFQGPPDFTTRHARVRPSLHKRYGRAVCNFDISVCERERENIVLVGSYAKFAPNPVIRSHLLHTGDRILAKASPYDLIWSIGYRADDVPARQPSLGCDINLLGKSLHTVQRLFRGRAPPPTHHQLMSPQGALPSSRDCIFEVDRSMRQRLRPRDTSAAVFPSGYPDS